MGSTDRRDEEWTDPVQFPAEIVGIAMEVLRDLGARGVHIGVSYAPVRDGGAPEPLRMVSKKGVEYFKSVEVAFRPGTPEAMALLLRCLEAAVKSSN